MPKKKLIVILYSEAKREYFPTEEQFITEEEVYGRAGIIKKRLDTMGFETVLMPGNFTSIAEIAGMKPYIVFNLVDSISGREDLAPSIPAALDMIGTRYAGTGTIGLALCANKFLTKSVLKTSGINVPGFQLFKSGREKLNPGMKFPLIIKLNECHGSLEIGQDSIVQNEAELRTRISYLQKKYGQSIIAEEYIRGKEMTALIIYDKNDPLILAEERVLFRKRKYPVFGFEEAWSDEEFYDVKKFDFPPEMKETILKAFEVLEMGGYARFEVILDDRGKYFFIDLNANPAIGPKEAGEAFGYLLYLYRIPFEKVIETIIKNSP